MKKCFRANWTRDRETEATPRQNAGVLLPIPSNTPSNGHGSSPFSAASAGFTPAFLLTTVIVGVLRPRVYQAIPYKG
jgi:hypothetical protein